MFDEDLSIFFDDFAVDFTWQGQTAKGILDQSTFVVQGQVLSVNDKDLTLYKPHDVFPLMAPHELVYIGGVTYKIKRVSVADDGAVDAIALMKAQ